MQTKAVRCLLIPISLVKSRNKRKCCSGHQAAGTLVLSSGRCKLAQPFWENTRLWQKLMSGMWSRIKLVALYPDELQVGDPTKACTWVFRAAPCTKGHKLEAAKTSPSSVWIRKPAQTGVLPSRGLISSIGCKWSNHTKIWRNSTIIFLSDNILNDNETYF